MILVKQGEDGQQKHAEFEVKLHKPNLIMIELKKENGRNTTITLDTKSTLDLVSNLFTILQSIFKKGD